MKSALATCVLGQDVFLSPSLVSSSDLLRASSKVQSGRLAGKSPQEIANKLNAHLLNYGGAKRSCDDHTVQELNDILSSVFAGVASEFDDVYKKTMDLRVKRFQTLAEYEQSWQSEVDDLATRHAKCFEIGEMWSHHLPESIKKAHVGVVPKLPTYNSALANNTLYTRAASCQTGHAMVKGGDGTSTHQWPDWPEELHYKAKGHGAYPFWWGGGSDSGTADLEVWYSEKQGAEKFYHSSCTGQSSWLRGACVHLLLSPGVGDMGNTAPQGYLYLEDESKCCLTQPTAGGGSGPAETLAAPQSNFWNTFAYQGEVDFNGVYYQGKAKYYVLSGVNEPVRDFWYFTDLDGKPVQQGEAGTGPTDQGYPQSIGHTIWHDFDPSSLDVSSIDSSTFDIPDVCKTTTLSCAFP